MAGESFHTSWFNGVESLGQIRYVEPFVNHPLNPGAGDVSDPAYFDTATFSGVPSVHFSVADQNNNTQLYEGRNVDSWGLLADSNGETLKTNYAFSTDTLDPDYDGYSWAATGGLTPAPCIRFSGMRMVGYAIFEYENGLPEGWQAMAQWTAQRWLDGDRRIHPGLL